MRSDEGRDGIAENIFRAFSTFKQRYDSSMQVTSARQEEPKKEEPLKEESQEAAAPAPAPEGPVYGIQVLATGKNMSDTDPFFHGYKPLVVKSGKLNKYILLTDPSLKTVKASLGKIKHFFPDSYLVKIEDNSTVPVR